MEKRAESVQVARSLAVRLGAYVAHSLARSISPSPLAWQRQPTALYAYLIVRTYMDAFKHTAFQQQRADSRVLREGEWG